MKISGKSLSKPSGSLHNDEKELQMLRAMRKYHEKQEIEKKKREWLEEVESGYLKNFDKSKEGWITGVVRKDEKKTEEDVKFFEQRKEFDEYDKFLMREWDFKQQKIDKQEREETYYNVPEKYEKEVHQFMKPLLRMAGEEHAHIQKKTFESLDEFLHGKTKKESENYSKICKLLEEKVYEFDKASPMNI